MREPARARARNHSRTRGRQARRPGRRPPPGPPRTPRRARGPRALRTRGYAPAGLWSRLPQPGALRPRRVCVSKPLYLIHMLMHRRRPRGRRRCQSFPNEASLTPRRRREAHRSAPALTRARGHFKHQNHPQKHQRAENTAQGDTEKNSRSRCKYQNGKTGVVLFATSWEQERWLIRFAALHVSMND